MKTQRNFEEPFYEIIRIDSNVIVTSEECSCVVGGYDMGTDDTCTGANVACTCNPNYTDPSANCT